MKIKIAIADDHPLVINGLRHILSNNPNMEIIASYPDGEALLEGIELVQPDVLLLDIQMPGQTGDEIAEIIKQKFPAIKMLALTNQDNVYYIKTMMKKGVLGYVLKTTSEEILLEAILTVYGGGIYLEPGLKDRLVQSSLLGKQQNPVAPILSRREKEILKYLGQNLTSQQIADKLFLSKRTVDQHRMSLLMKLEVKNVAALIKKGLQMGLID